MEYQKQNLAFGVRSGYVEIDASAIHAIHFCDKVARHHLTFEKCDSYPNHLRIRIDTITDEIYLKDFFDNLGTKNQALPKLLMSNGQIIEPHHIHIGNHDDVSLGAHNHDVDHKRIHREVFGGCFV